MIYTAVIGAQELLIILAVATLLFGAKKVPELARSLGTAQREFKEGLRDGGTTPDADERDQQPVA